MTRESHAQVHRFWDSVYTYVRGDDGGRTHTNGGAAYLRPADARKLARALNAAARSVERESFVDSKVGTVDIAAPDGRDYAHQERDRKRAAIVRSDPSDPSGPA